MIRAGACLLLCMCWVRFCSPVHAQTGSPDNQRLALVGARIYPSPADPIIESGVVLIENGRIKAVGEREQIAVPSDATSLDCSGLTLLAGFWNSHVHFTEPRWANAARIPAAELSRRLRAAFSRYGFTSVFDLGSPLENTTAIRQRIASGEVEGVGILTTGSGFVPRGGTPFYIKPVELPEVLDTRQAAALVVESLSHGADAIKVFTAPSPIEGGSALVMRLELVQAITAEAHRHGKLIFAHPENDAGVNVAIDGGVDVLAHSAPTGSRWDEAEITRMMRARVSLIPTLSLFTKVGRQLGMPAAQVDRFISIPVEQLRAYSQAGGQVLFGTDVGFVTDYDPAEEYLLMARAGMSFRQILASLTSNPADRFGFADRLGRIAAGLDGDLVLIAGDPERDLKALSNVRYTVRRGRIVYRQAS